MGTTQLLIYNQTLAELGNPALTTVSDDVDARYKIDTIYAQVLAECLQEAYWKFAIRTSQESSDGTPTVHDYQYYYTVPTDWVRTVAISGYSSFQPGLDRFELEDGKWYCDVSPLYLRYISNDAAYGGDLTAWPASYTRYVILTMAERAAIPVTGSRTLADSLAVRAIKAKGNAKSIDAVESSTRWFPAGRWTTSRGASIGSTRYDRQDP